VRVGRARARQSFGGIELGKRYELSEITVLPMPDRSVEIKTG
jgi:hypothetical protein